MTSMTWQCDGQDETRAESLMGLETQGLRFHHGGVGRRRHRFARGAQPRPKASQPTQQRDDLDRALAVERTTREALQRRIRELEGKLASLSGAHATPSTSDEMALLDLKTSLSGAAAGAIDLEPLQLWLAEAELRADAAAGAGGWTGGEVDLIPSLVDLPTSRPKARPEDARVAFEAAEARAAHNAAQVRRLTEELAEARSEQMKTMARLRELEAKFRYAEERAGLAGEALQNYLPEPPSTWKQPDFVPEEPVSAEQTLDDALAAWGGAEGEGESAIAEPTSEEEDISLDDALASWGSGEAGEDTAAESATEDEAISLDDALASWGKADLEPEEPATDAPGRDDRTGEEDLDDVLAAWGEGDLSGVGGQAVEEEDEASLEALSDALGAWDEAEDSASEHRATGQVDDDTEEDPDLDPITGGISGFTAQEPAADFSPEESEEAEGEETAQPYLDTFATGEQAEAAEKLEEDEDALTDALTGWGADEQEVAAEQVQEELRSSPSVFEDPFPGDTSSDEDHDVAAALDASPQTDSESGELDMDSLDDVPLEEISEEQPVADAPVDTPDSLEEAIDADDVLEEIESAEEDDPREDHTWGPAIADELSDTEEAEFESGLAAASSPVDYMDDTENDEETFEPDIAIDEASRNYENGGAAAEIDEQLSDDLRATYASESTPELHLDDEVAEQSTVHEEVEDDASPEAEASAEPNATASSDFETEPDFAPEMETEREEAMVEEDDAVPSWREDTEGVSGTEESSRDSESEAPAMEAPGNEANIDVDSVVAARMAGREAVEGNVDPESMRRSLRDWSGLAAARREAAAREVAADATPEPESQPLRADRDTEELSDARSGGLREKMRASREVHGKKKMVDALMRFMGDR